jgi:hypothetical protein
LINLLFYHLVRDEVVNYLQNYRSVVVASTFLKTSSLAAIREARSKAVVYTFAGYVARFWIERSERNPLAAAKHA